MGDLNYWHDKTFERPFEIMHLRYNYLRIRYKTYSNWYAGSKRSPHFHFAFWGRAIRWVVWIDPPSQGNRRMSAYKHSPDTVSRWIYVHPTTFFCGKITLCRSKYCLELSAARERLEISGQPFHLSTKSIGIFSFKIYQLPSHFWRFCFSHFTTKILRLVFKKKGPQKISVKRQYVPWNFLRKVRLLNVL